MPLLYEDDEEGGHGRSQHPYRLGGHRLVRREGSPCATRQQLPCLLQFEPVLLRDGPQSLRLSRHDGRRARGHWRRISRPIASATTAPPPCWWAKCLSERTAQQGDLREKLRIYALLGIREYILIDVTGEYLPQRLLLKRLRRNRTWKDEQDARWRHHKQIGLPHDPRHGWPVAGTRRGDGRALCPAGRGAGEQADARKRRSAFARSKRS